MRWAKASLIMAGEGAGAERRDSWENQRPPRIGRRGERGERGGLHRLERGEGGAMQWTTSRTAL